LYSFNGGNDGAFPHSEVVFDRAGDIFGTTYSGGQGGVGTVYKLIPSQGGWSESVIYNFGGNSGGSPQSGVILDSNENLYGTTQQGFGYNYGTVYELTPSGAGWSENTLYSFLEGDDGGQPIGGLLFDTAGNLYGTTSFGGSGGGGTVFELSHSGSGWAFNLLQSFPGYQQLATGPHASLTMDSAGNLYGTTYGEEGGPNYGTVFELSPTSSGWVPTVLHYFDGFDGQLPISNVIFDASGNMYGTASQGAGYGAVWEITPERDQLRVDQGRPPLIRGARNLSRVAIDR